MPREFLSCAEAQGALRDIKSLRDEFGCALEEALQSQDRTQAHILAKSLESRMRELRDNLISPIERKLDVKRQYEAQAALLESTGILKRFSSGEMGIHGIDGKAYPMPSYQEIRRRIRERRDVLKEKSEQGFTKFLIVPFGIALDDLVENYKAVILKHEAEGKLLGTKEDDTDPDEPLDLDVSEPVWVWDEYKDADVNGTLIYNPQEFTEHHGGSTKAEILAAAEEASSGAPLRQSFEGQAWRIIMIEENQNIPRLGKGKDKGGRKRIEANKTPSEYLEVIGKGPYQHESGTTPEEWLMQAITTLEEKNQVIDDYQGKGSIAYNTGAYFISGLVPCASWFRGLSAGVLGRGRSGGSRCQHRRAVCGEGVGFGI